MRKICLALFVCLCVYGVYLIYSEDIRRKIPREKIKETIQKGSDELNKLIIKKKRSYPDRELFKSSIILRNLSLVRQETPLSADYIYEKLMENSELLRPMYGVMLTLYRSGKDEEAFRVPAEMIGSKAAKNFGLILSKLDRLNPAELTEQMEIFQNGMIEKQMSDSLRKTQRNSVIITALSAVSIFALLINFTVVVVFMDSLNMITSMFG